MKVGSATRCPSKSEAFATEVEALASIDVIRQLARDGVNPTSATMTVTDCGESVMPLAVWDLEAKTLDPYLAGLASASSARPRAPCGPDDQQRPTLL